jgi:hypothetical protein
MPQPVRGRMVPGSARYFARIDLPFLACHRAMESYLRENELPAGCVQSRARRH